MFNAKSGYTEGTVSFGVDLYATLGVKLNSSDAPANTGLLPNAFGDEGPVTYSELSGVAKMKISRPNILRPLPARRRQRSRRRKRHGVGP